MLTPMQQAFVEHYAASGNATEAARLAGYKKRDQGYENLKRPIIQDALAALAQARTQARIATLEERQSFWTSVLRGEEGYGADMRDRLKASELLSRVQGDFLERREVTGPNGAPLHAPDLQVIFVNALPVAD